MSTARTAESGCAADPEQTGVVSGHDFSRAESSHSTTGASAPGTNPLAVLLLGPTGSGKTALSLTLAQRFKGEIVSCDSVAVYRGMDTGDRQALHRGAVARFPITSSTLPIPMNRFTAGAYSRAARAVLREIAVRGRLPIVTGGTGLYLRALTEGLYSRARAASRRFAPGLNNLDQNEGKTGCIAFSRASTQPPPPASMPTTRAKLIRAIEVCLAARKPLSQVHGARSPHRLPPAPDRPESAPPGALQTAQPPLPRPCLPRAWWTRPAGVIRPLWPDQGPRFARLPPGARSQAGTLTEEAAIKAAQQGHRNLRQAPVHLVSPRAGCPLARRASAMPRRPCSHPMK
jgi:tRNA dimethylallyltransferase